jgi:hypothetical protein
MRYYWEVTAQLALRPGYRMHKQGLVFRFLTQARDIFFLLPTASRPALEPTRTPIQWVLEAHSPERGGEASCTWSGELTTSSAEVLMRWGWVHLVLQPLFGLLYQPPMTDDDCGAIGGMRIGRRNRSTRIKPASMPLCPPQIPRDLPGLEPGAAVVGSRRLTPPPTS